MIVSRYLEQLVAGLYKYQGYFVRRASRANVRGIVTQMSPAVLSLVVASVIFSISAVAVGQNSANNTWYYYSPSSDTVVIFVHGIFSDSSACWTAPNGIFWPDLVRGDQRLGKPSIYLGGYYTDFSSGLYRIPDAARELLSYLKTNDPSGRPAPLSKPNLLFIAHSTGGLVVRYLLERNQDIFLAKNVGLILLASPSRGSAWANRLKWISEYFKNKMARQLERDNDFVMDLDGRFSDMVAKRSLPNLKGLDAFENKFIIRGTFFDTTYVVSANDSASYLGAYRIVPNSDHFSIAKPTSLSHPSHQLLVEFYETIFVDFARPQTQACILRFGVIKDDHNQTDSTYRFVVTLGEQVAFNELVGDEVPHGAPYGGPFNNWSELPISINLDTSKPPPLSRFSLWRHVKRIG